MRNISADPNAQQMSVACSMVRFRAKQVARLNVLIDHLTSWAKANGLSEIRLTVYSTNDPAIRAYEKAGFAPYITEMRLNLDE